jgi:glycosyltransferase involved in cell wall biosynthesis
VHYVHAAYASPIAGSSARRLWQHWKQAKAQRDEARALARARLVVANSEATRALLHSRLGIPETRLHRVYYGCEAEFRPASAQERASARQELGWNEHRAKLLFVGALGDRRKGFDTLFGAWQRLRQGVGWEVDLVVVGRGSELASWQRRARAAGMGNSCEFLGYREDIPRLLAASDGLVAPTRYEAYGLGVQEALACGRPAIVSAGAGVSERVPASLRALLLNDPESVDELVERLEWWQRHQVEIKAALQVASEAIRSRSWDTMAEEIAALMDEARQ